MATNFSGRTTSGLVIDMDHHQHGSMKEGGGCHHGDGGGGLQESRREGPADGCQERPQVRRRWSCWHTGSSLKICWPVFLQGDGPQPNWADFPCRVQTDGGEVRQALLVFQLCRFCLTYVCICISVVFVFQLCRFCLTHVWKNLLTNPIDQVPRLCQQLQNQALDCWIANLYIKCYFPHVVFINHQQNKIGLVDPGIPGLRSMGPDVHNWETFVKLKWLNFKFMK